MPTLAMGCGVFLQSDIVNQQRKGWSAEEIMASLAAVLPLNVWVYAGQLQNLAAAGRKFILQGGTHRNLAVVKAQVDFITGRVPDAEILVHPYPGEAGAIGAALCALGHLVFLLSGSRFHQAGRLGEDPRRDHQLLPRKVFGRHHREEKDRKPARLPAAFMTSAAQWRQDRKQREMHRTAHSSRPDRATLWRQLALSSASFSGPVHRRPRTAGCWPSD